VPEPVRILRLITRLNAGGPGRHVLWLTEGMTALGYQTDLVTGSVPPGEDDLTVLAHGKGLALRQIPELSREVRFLADAKASWKIAALLEEISPDILHTHTSKAGLVGRAGAALVNRRRRARGLPPIAIIHTFHGNVFSGYFSPPKAVLFRFLERYLARHATDAIVVLAPQQRAEIVERFRIAPAAKVFVVPLGLDLSEFQKLPPRGAFRREAGFGPDDFVVGIVGRIAAVKDHPLFLRSAAILARRLPKARFAVVGGGEGLSRLPVLARDLGIAGRVFFAGLRTVLAAIYADLDAVTLTSRNEGTPLSLIEAMAAGRAIAAADVGGVRDLLTAEWEGEITSRRFFSSARPRGLLVPPGDPEQLASALETLARDGGLGRALGQSGREYAFRYHGLRRLLDDLDRLYRLVLAT